MGEEVEVQVQFLTGQITCALWSQVLILQAFEWELITSLISFQKDLDADQIGVRRESYIKKEERKVVYRYWAGTAYNLTFHSVKILMFYLLNDRSKWK